MNRSPLRARSLKLQRAMAVYRRQVAAFLADHDTCEHPTNHPDGFVRSSVVHHRRGRFGKRLLDQRYWAASCNPCNAEAEENTGKSLDCGWLIPVESIAAYAESLRDKGRAS